MVIKGEPASLSSFFLAIHDGLRRCDNNWFGRFCDDKTRNVESFNYKERNFTQG